VAVGCPGGRPAVAPSIKRALLRIGGKRKPRATGASGASRTGNLGEGMGGVVSCPLTRDNGAGWIRFRGQVNKGSLAMLAAMRRASSRVSRLLAAVAERQSSNKKNPKRCMRLGFLSCAST
jgi:hypothetical protein